VDSDQTILCTWGKAGNIVRDRQRTEGLRFVVPPTTTLRLPSTRTSLLDFSFEDYFRDIGRALPGPEAEAEAEDFNLDCRCFTLI
jgi:hypothetical protein